MCCTSNTWQILFASINCDKIPDTSELAEHKDAGYRSDFSLNYAASFILLVIGIGEN